MIEIEIVEDTLTTWVDGTLADLNSSRLEDVLKEVLEEIYYIVEDDVPYQEGYLRGSGKEWEIVNSGEAVGAMMVFSGEDNPIENRIAHGWTSPPIFPDKPYAQYQYFNRDRPWFDKNWKDIEDTFMDSAEIEMDSIIRKGVF